MYNFKIEKELFIMKKFIIYTYSKSVVTAGEESCKEIDGVYVIINEYLEAECEAVAISVTAAEREMEPSDLIAVELK